MQAICIYLVINSHTQLVSPSSQALKNNSTVYPYLFPCHPLDHDRMSSIPRVLHSATWVYFTSRLPYRVSRSPKVVKEAIMTDINDLMQEFWRTSSDGAVRATFFAMSCLLKILQRCLNISGFNISVLCFDIIPATFR